MTWIRVAITIVLLSTLVSCDVLDPQDEAAPEPTTAVPISFQLEGQVSMEFTLSDVHTCEEVLLADLPAPTTNKEANAKIRHQEAQSQIELIMDRTVTIRDADEGEHLATVETDDEIATANLEGDDDPDDGDVNCVASTSFTTVLPPVDNYIFVVRGITGDPEPVSYEDLQEAGFVCDIRIGPSGRLVDNASCGV